MTLDKQSDTIHLLCDYIGKAYMKKRKNQGPDELKSAISHIIEMLRLPSLYRAPLLRRLNIPKDRALTIAYARKGQISFRTLPACIAKALNEHFRYLFQIATWDRYLKAKCDARKRHSSKEPRRPGYRTQAILPDFFVNISKFVFWKPGAKSPRHNREREYDSMVRSLAQRRNPDATT